MMRYGLNARASGLLALGLLLLLIPADVGAETLRVKILDRGSKVRLTSSQPFFAQTVSGQFVSRALFREMTVSLMQEIAINRQETYENTLIFTPQRGELLSLNGTSYAGAMRVYVERGALSVINLVDLEQYLEGVVPSEMPQDWPMEALKAQAVISRTYALYQTLKNKHKPYDLQASVLGQVYKGTSSARPRTHQAILQTHGITVMYEGTWALTFFHSTSAGHTEDANELWGIDLPYLKGVSCPFDKASPYFQWERAIPLADIEQAMAQQQQRVGTIATLAPFQYSKAGRILKLRILHEEGETFLRGEDLRRLIGYQTIPSMNFQITSFGETITLRGSGFGHGVGLCQWGAKALAERGLTFDDIILYYYPGVSLE